MAYTVDQRRQEIGIRMAFGAPATQVRKMVVRQGIGLAGFGIVLGLGAAWALARLLEGFLFGVKTRDPIVFSAVPVILFTIALVAVWIPATRASRINPVDALRLE
jgi:ABC-type antimicrobial peptide transport system permease subunit